MQLKTKTFYTLNEIFVKATIRLFYLQKWIHAFLLMIEMFCKSRRKALSQPALACSKSTAKTSKQCLKYSKLAIKTPEQDWCHSSVFIVTFKQISHIVLVCPLSGLPRLGCNNKYLRGQCLVATVSSLSAGRHMSHDIAKLIFRYTLEKAYVSNLFEKSSVGELRITACNSLKLVSFAKKITEKIF